jgi:hypothetical protein
MSGENVGAQHETPIDGSGVFVDSEIAADDGEVDDVTEPEIAPTKAPESEDFCSTTNPPKLRLVSSGFCSTTKSPQNVPQTELIESSPSEWKRLRNKPPKPPKHTLNPSGKRRIGGITRTGFEILRRADCERCGKEIRLVAGFISATQMIALGGLQNDTQIGVIRNILRRKAREIDNRLVSLRCAGGCAGRDDGALRLASTS